MSISKHVVLSLVLIVYLGIVSSCTEKYFPKIESTEGILVVDGRITNAPPPYEVKLFRTVELDSKDSIRVERNAQIIIHCDDGNSAFLYEYTPGKYRTRDLSFKGEIGKNYWVEITTQDNITYESTPEEMLSAFEIKNIYGEEEKIIIDLDEQLDAVRFYFDLENTDNTINYYLWDYKASWEWHTISNIPKSANPAYVCYPEEDSNNVNIYDATSLSTQQVKHLPLAIINENQVNLNYEYYIKAHTYSISQSCYKFWNNIKKISESNGSLFDIIPANTPGNIQCCSNNEVVLGYFQVSSQAEFGSTFSYKEFGVSFKGEPTECRTFQINPLTYDPKKHHVISVETLKEGGSIYFVKYSFCYDCSLKYSPNKPSFWP